MDPPATQAATATGQAEPENETLESKESTVAYEHEEEIDKEMLEKLKAHEKAALRCAPFRTSEDQPALDEQGRYIPRIVCPPKSKFSAEVETSAKAEANFRTLWHALTEANGRIAIEFMEGAKAEDRKLYPLAFDLANGNGFELLNTLQNMKRGDVWRCTIYGDELWHFPTATRNVYDDPRFRAACAKLEADVRMLVLKKINKQRSAKLKLELRITKMEQVFEAFEEITKMHRSQTNAIGVLLMLRTHQRYDKGAVDYIRQEQYIIRDMLTKCEEKLQAHSALLESFSKRLCDLEAKATLQP